MREAPACQIIFASIHMFLYQSINIQRYHCYSPSNTSTTKSCIITRQVLENKPMLLQLFARQVPKPTNSLRIIQPLIGLVIQLLNRDVISSSVLVGLRSCGAEKRVH